MDALLLTLLGVGWGGFLSLLGATVLGQLVPGHWRERADQWRAAYDRERENTRKQQQIIDRAMLSSEITEKVAAAVAQIITPRSGGRP